MRPEQIPRVAHAIKEDRNASVGFIPWFSNDGHPSRDELLVSSIEVIHPKKETHPSTGLLPDDRRLLWTVSPRKEKARLSTIGPYDDPPLGLPAFYLSLRVLNQVEAEHADEELDGPVVIVDDEGD
jgi:hypothetical protein